MTFFKELWGEGVADDKKQIKHFINNVKLIKTKMKKEGVGPVIKRMGNDYMSVFCSDCGKRIKPKGQLIARYLNVPFYCSKCLKERKRRLRD